MTQSSQDSFTSSEENGYRGSPVQAVLTLTTANGVVIDRIELGPVDLDESHLNVFKGSLGERLTEEARKHGGNQ